MRCRGSWAPRFPTRGLPEVSAELSFLEQNLLVKNLLKCNGNPFSARVANCHASSKE